jgi:putative DNA primase/helicase
MMTTNGKAAIFDAVSMLCERGLPILPCNGKKPFHPDWQHRTYTADEVLAYLRRVADPMIGLRFGPGSCIDIEADSPDEEDIFAKLFADCEPPTTPTFKSTRGKHRLFAWHDRLAETRKGIISFKGSNGAKLGIRIGADGKGAQSIIPPSPGREWLVSLDDCDPAPLPDVVIERLLAAARKPKAEPTSNGRAPQSDSIIERARKYLAKIPPAISGQGGHDATFHGACCLVLGFALDREPALALLREWNENCQPPWADHELEHKIDDALEQPGERGYLINGEAERKTTRGASVESPTRHTTDVGNAERFAEQHGADVRYCHPWGKWLIWDNRRWGIDTTGEIVRRAKLVARSIYVEASKATDKDWRESLAKWAAASERRERLTATVALAESEHPIPIAVESLDAHPWLLNCENGTLDLRTGELRAHRREDYLTKCCPVEYPTEPGIDPNLWLSFLDRTFAGSAGKIGFLRRLMGCSLVGEVLEHILPIFHGPGANGKSVLIETWSGMLGPDYAIKAPANFLICKRGETHPTELADLHGKRLVAAVETADGGRLSESLVKELTGGDSIRARRMREDFWQFRPSHTVVLATNHRPVIRGTDFAVWRRVRLVPFNVTIPEAEQDRELSAKLRAEWPAILRWAVAGCIEWQASGLNAPKEVLAATDNYRADSDTLGEFIDECCVVGPEHEAKASDLYRAYKAWAESHGEDVENQTRFGNRLTERDFEKHKSHGRIQYRGIGLGRVGG